MRIVANLDGSPAEINHIMENNELFDTNHIIDGNELFEMNHTIETNELPEMSYMKNNKLPEIAEEDID